MIKEEVVWGFDTLDEALYVATKMDCREGYEPVVQYVTVREFVPRCYLVVERKVEE
jgi:hypothetical protein